VGIGKRGEVKKRKSYVPVAKIKNALRRIHMHDKQRTKAKAKCKADVATYKCESCSLLIYEGVSDKRYEELKENWNSVGKDLVRGKLELDHKVPVVDVKIGYADWNTYIERLYCGPDDYQGLCRDCHADKSAKEAGERKDSGSLKRKK